MSLSGNGRRILCDGTVICPKEGAKRMKIQYRMYGEGVQIVRCWGTDPVVVLPRQIRGLPVISAAAYTFSMRKDGEDTDVLIWETPDDHGFREEEYLLAGERISYVVLPETMTEIGNYIFYGCRELKGLEFSGRLTKIGSGAFTGCRSLCSLRAELDDTGRSVAGEILGDLWQRMDVTFVRSGEEARLVFPEHYEEAVENTPARILFTQHHGSGNHYRQCFYDKEMDYRKYDSLFSVAKAQDSVPVLTDLVFDRLMYPVELTEHARQEYETWVRDNGVPAGKYLTDCSRLDSLRHMCRRKLWNGESLEQTLEYAGVTGKTEVLVLLMNERNLYFPGRRRNYDL